MNQEILDIIHVIEDYANKGILIYCGLNRFTSPYKKYQYYIFDSNTGNLLHKGSQLASQKEALLYAIYYLETHQPQNMQYVLNKVHYIDSSYNIPFIINSIAKMRKQDIHIWISPSYTFYEERILGFKACAFYISKYHELVDVTTKVHTNPWEALLKILQIVNRIYKSKRPLTVNERGFLYGYNNLDEADLVF